MAKGKSKDGNERPVVKTETENGSVNTETTRMDTTPTGTQVKRSWWYWRRPQNPVETNQTTKSNELEDKNDGSGKSLKTTLETYDFIEKIFLNR